MNATEYTNQFFCGDCGSSEGEMVSNISRRVSAPGIKGSVVNLVVDGLSGFKCACGEIELDEPSHAKYAAAGDEFVKQQRALIASTLRAQREHLGLTQLEASEISGGGHNAFSRYERGLAVPVPAVRHLFYLMNRHPVLLDELRAASQEQYAVV